MPLAPNSKLGPYEIKSTLGVGGMGEVYRARDSRLNRDVAIKVLRQDATPGSNSPASADLRSRFEREARAVAALNHPNIIAVYDFGVEAAQQYIVSELLEGESLRALLKGKPLPLRKLIEIAAQVADGLATAHAAGIVHRDMKPENIMLTKDGRAKILDFGLARHAPAATAPAIPAGSDQTFVPPTQNLTSAGSILGTAAYMSPELALGQETGYRSDQFSFGLILYEMASGKQAFAKPSSVETMAAIVREEPPAIEEKIPAPLKWIIDRCLHKEPEQRYESTRDLFHELKNLRDHFSEAYTSESFAAVSGTRRKPKWWKIPTISAACIALTASLVYVLKPSGQDIGNYRYTPFASYARGGIWSPDGKSVAYTGKVARTDQVFLRLLNSSVPIQMTHEQKSVRPLGWSSDGSHIIIVDSSLPNHIYSLSAVGGDPELIMVADCYTCALSKDGRVLASFTGGKDGYSSVEISAPLGSPLVPYKPAPFAEKKIYSGAELHFSPDGKSILLLNDNKSNKQEAWLLPYPGGGEVPKTVLTQIATLKDTPSFDWMPDNRHIVASISTEPNAPSHLWLADVRSNQSTPMTGGIADESVPRVAPDGKSILLTQYSDSLNVVSLSVLDGTAKTLVDTGHLETMASWSARQQKLAWVTNRGGTSEVWLRSADGSERSLVTAPDSPDTRFMNPSISPTGDRLIFTRSDSSGVIRLWISSLSGGAPIRLTNADTGTEFGGAWSPDGSRFAYLSAGEGPGTLMIVRTGGGAVPSARSKDDCFALSDWSPTGEWITCMGSKGWSLISPDGKPAKFLGSIETPYLAFSKDGKTLYGILTTDPKTGKDVATLFSLNITTLKQTVIKELGVDFQPTTSVSPGIRFSMAPDGKSFVYSIGKSRTDLWMLTGYRQPGLWNQIKEALHLGTTK